MHENASRFRKECVRVDESPDPVGRVIGEEFQCVILGVACEVSKLRDSFIVKEDCIGFVNL